MQDILGSVRRSLVFRNSQGEESVIAEKIGSCLRKSRLGFLSKRPLPTLSNSSPPSKELAPPIRWRKGELIGCGAFGRVYMGMNQDSGELLAVKQVSIAAGNASKDKAQAHIRELEEEVKLLRNLSHPNIVRYLGTTRDDENLNILLELIPGGSISSLLGKFGPFPEAVIRNYTKQLLQGLEYLHQNGIIHRDIKGANILVDNKGCIKVADFGASKKVVELVTVSGAKSMKGTPYWMAPEVILQTGHSFSADIWSVGCTIIEMATGKPPWSEQYQEVAALFHIGTTRSHPPIPKHLSMEANDFLLKCLQREPSMRPTASDLLQHPFIAKEFRDMHSIPHPSVTERSTSSTLKTETCMNNNLSPPTGTRTSCTALKDTCNFESLKCSNLWTSNDMCQLDEDFEVVGSQGINFTSMSDQFDKSFNPMMESLDDWPCKFDGSPEQRGIDLVYFGESVDGAASIAGASGKGEIDFTFPCDPINEDDEIIESKIKAFLDEKALELKKLQTPLYEEFYSTLNAYSSPDVKENLHGDDIRDSSDFPSKTMSPSKVASGTSPRHVGSINLMSPGSRSRRISSCGVVNSQILREIPLPQLNEWRELLDNQQHSSPSSSYSERQRKWKEELDEELERERAMKRQAGICGKTSFPMHRIPSRKRDRLWYESISKNE